MATGHHVAAWRHPQGQSDAGLNFAHYKQIVQKAEQAKFDMMFLADNASVCPVSAGRAAPVMVMETPC